MGEKAKIDRRRLLGAAAVAGWGVWAMSGSAEASGRAAAVSRRVGDLEVVALLDASGAFPMPASEAFPAATAQDWEAARCIDPDAFGAEDAWLLDFRCHAVRRPDGRITVIDSGIGPVGSPASSWAPVPGSLPEVLEAAGISAADVDTVVMTHLHGDHCGWAVLPGGTPMFPDARYVVQGTELEHLDPSGAVWSYVVEPLRSHGLLDPIDGSTRLARRITAIPTPGHTIGHQSVVIESRRTSLVVTGDALVHAVQLADPTVAYVFEDDPDAAVRTREALFARASARRTIIATSHLRRPFVRVRSRP